ncbi:hypothetical protein [Arsenicicoccus sp. oral taxon 190]|uniref:hypothetical protein n=1 Tax=Arsenicicoccus sp. oral taxon 190 TaxID=1658671 RepID=UPI00067A1BAE|nr:hypothetical protein [Arsenicicoccus sp. oral taxon 190]AKT51605.1 hypothetical protein ADJ73_10400 [Arsenicicoccus sp. oral taxon 190]
MAEIAITLTVPLPREVVWRRLWSPSRHTAAIPLTVVTSTSDPMAQPGSRVVARTSVGPVGFDDVMEVVDVATPPDGAWECRIHKRGRVIRGAIAVTVQDRTGSQDGVVSEVRWRQRIFVAGLPAVLDPVVGGAAWLAYRTGIRRIIGG